MKQRKNTNFPFHYQLVLGTIGALMGTLAAIGVVVVGNDLSTDQDSICTTVSQ